MNRITLQVVTGPKFQYECKGCGVRGFAGSGCMVWADISGEPFKAYYCLKCSTGLWTGSPSVAVEEMQS